MYEFSDKNIKTTKIIISQVTDNELLQNFYD